MKKFKNDGGQNPILAAKHGCKIYHGPYVFNFKDIYDFLGEKKISKEILNNNELIYNLKNDFSNNQKDIINTQILINNLGDEILTKTLSKIKTLI